MNEKTAGLIQMIGEQQRGVSQAWLERVYADAGVKWEKPAGQRSIPSERAPAPAPVPIDED